MNGSGFSLWTSGVWIIPVVLLATVVGLYLLVRHWRNQTVHDLKKLRSELRRLQTSHRQLTQAMEGHTEEDPEPYGSRVAAIHAQLEDIHTQIVELEYQHVGFQERAHSLTANRLQSIIGAPYLWYQLRKDLQHMWLLLEKHEATHHAARASHQSLAHLGLDIARQARQVQELEVQTTQILDQLRSRNLQGPALHEATRQVNEIHAELAQVPVVYLNGDETAVLELVEKTSVTQVHQIVERARPILEDINTRGQTWDQQYTAMIQKVAALDQALASLEAILDSMPSALVLNESQTRYQTLVAAVNKLHTSLMRPELETLVPSTNEAERLLQAVQELAGQLKRSRGQLSSLEQVLPELSTSIKRIATQFAALGTHRTHPILWNQSSARLTNLSQQASALGTAQKPRSLVQLEQDLVAAARLNAEQKALAEICQQAADEHRQILDLLASPELRAVQLPANETADAKNTEPVSRGSATGVPNRPGMPAAPGNSIPQWLLSAQQLVDQVADYDPENWLRIDSVTTLPAELPALVEGFRELAPVAGKAYPLQETDISQHLEAIRHLSQAAQGMRVRLSNIQKRLTDIQQIETQTQEKLERTQVLFHQISLLVGSNPYLSEVAGQEPEKLKQSLEQISNDLAQSQSGSVEKKAKNIANLEIKVENTSNQWLDRLNQDIREAAKELSSNLAALDAVAALEEPAIDEGRRLLSAGPSVGVSDYRQKARFNLDELVGEMKRRSDYWQALEANLRALADMQSHILDANQQVSQARQSVQEQMTEVSTWIKQSRGYPPTDENLNQERQELTRLEDQLEALRSQHMRGIALVAQLGNLAARYQALGEKVRQVSERVARKSEEFERLETELADFNQTWQNHWHARRENTLASEEIRSLLEDSDRELEQIRQQCRQARLAYEPALQALKTIHMKVRLHQIALDETHLMNINGRISTYKPRSG